MKAVAKHTKESRQQRKSRGRTVHDDKKTSNKKAKTNDDKDEEQQATGYCTTLKVGLNFLLIIEITS